MENDHAVVGLDRYNRLIEVERRYYKVIHAMKLVITSENVEDEKIPVDRTLLEEIVSGGM